MSAKFDFGGFFVFDVANNHQGSLDHGLTIVREVGTVARDNGVRAGLKLQLRDLDTFIHPAHRNGSDNKHVGRFLATRLGPDDFRRMFDEARALGMTTVATPFDEISVAWALEIGTEVLKVASCSAADWPLLEAVADTGRPVIVSTAGLSMAGIDAVVSFLDHRRVHFALMHCVAVYPTPGDRLGLNQIALLRNRYPGRPIGFSTHEPPDNLEAVLVAVGRGAELFERHVASPAHGMPVNGYSSTPAQLDAWLKAHARARAMCGPAAGRSDADAEERASLQSLKRGVYVCQAVEAGAVLDRERVFFAMPCADHQLSSGEWNPGTVVTAALAAGDAVPSAAVVAPAARERQLIYAALHRVRAMLNEARVSLPVDFSLEISHHYGMGRFETYGAVIIDCINRSYCKKIIVQLPGQIHPNHYHKRKEEAFHVIHGTLHLDLDGRRRTLAPGDVQVILPGVWHEFTTDTGVIFEEISSTHLNGDSYYEDKDLNRMPRSERKTVVDHWGRHQL